MPITTLGLFWLRNTDAKRQDNSRKDLPPPVPVQKIKRSEAQKLRAEAAKALGVSEFELCRMADNFDPKFINYFNSRPSEKEMDDLHAAIWGEEI